MTPEGETRLRDHEGLRLKVYTDTVGKLTVGWGRNIEDVGISYDEAKLMLETDINRATAQARSAFPWFDPLDPVRQDVVVNLIFNMGLGGFKTFHNMIAAIERQDWHSAAFELFNSKWATQVGKTRRDDLCNAMEKGIWS